MIKLPLIHRRLSRDYAGVAYFPGGFPAARRALKRARTRLERREVRRALRKDFDA